ncbi:ECF-type sigma factor [Tahibacter harae]|uniref:ECF-type sigma factor n=1 Tax=Tahibacter harae TaxID=2963937 RepID=A0ABT1QTE9_9GAMM|nr:ECF-type sigma factor [Tahibacter harae]MCQ4165577.1 ECF-type sigma factor [Tahibacter harae]
MQAPIAQNAPLTALLQSWRQGDGASLNQVFEQAYAELRRIAAGRLRQVDGRSTLAPTELMHEAALRVLDAPVDWHNRAHFFASMSLYMRAVLVDHARARLADKRGGAQLHLSLGGVEAGDESGIAELLALEDALARLEILDARSSAVLHLTCFAGLSRHEIAEVLKVSVQIVDRELRFAKTWLNTQLGTAL